MKSGKSFSQIMSKTSWLIIFMLVFTGSASILTGCASKKSETTGQYVDDATITAKVKAGILNDNALKVNQISVETYKGVVQLSGFVDSQEQVKKAGDIAASVPGVVSVKNDLVVKK